MLERIAHLRKLFHEAVWETDISELPRSRTAYVRLLRVVYTVFIELSDGQLTLRAMSLVYTTLLSIVPLLAMSFSVLKAFGVHKQFEYVLYNFLSPLGTKGYELSGQVIAFVEEMKVGVLGSLGLALLFYTVISLVQKVERSFNYAWRVAEPRSMLERFGDYLSVVIVGPLLVLTALGMTAAVSGTSAFKYLAEIEVFGMLFSVARILVPYILVIVGFAFAYGFVPNTRVRLTSALAGGFVAGVLWQSVGWIFASFIVTSTNYTAIYSGFAIVILVLIWLYLSWLILLIGASVSFYYQNPAYLGIRVRELRLSNRMRERLALQMAVLIAKQFYHGGTPWTLAAFARRFQVPEETLHQMYRALESAGILLQVKGEPPALMPARDPGSVEVKEILDVLRSAEEVSQVRWGRVPRESTADGVLKKLDKAVEEALGAATLEELVADRRRESESGATEVLRTDTPAQGPRDGVAG